MMAGSGLMYQSGMQQLAITQKLPRQPGEMEKLPDEGREKNTHATQATGWYLLCWSAEGVSVEKRDNGCERTWHSCQKTHSSLS